MFYFSDRSNHTAEVVGSDRHSDLAVLSVANISKNELTPLTLANSSQLRIGENVVSVGNHFSYTKFTNTWYSWEVRSFISPES